VATGAGGPGSYVDLYWLPLGAGGRSVRLNGKVYEAVAARVAGRAPQDLYHSALEIKAPAGTYVIEQAPVLPRSQEDRGVVAVGAVGARFAGRLPVFRYEIRVWRGGSIPDVAEAVESPRRLTSSEDVAQRVLRSVPRVPKLVWGRDELATGEMWNSNSIVAWVLATGGIDASSISAPRGGRAPGWHAGVAAASRKGAGPGLG
jgi:hypothetical protein